MKRLKVSDSLNILKDELRVRTNSDLAKSLGVTDQTISNWKFREKLDLYLIMNICPNISLDRVLFGRDINEPVINNDCLAQRIINIQMDARDESFILDCTLTLRSELNNGN